MFQRGKEDGIEEKVANYVYQYIKQLGFEVHIEEVVPGRLNVIGIFDSKITGNTLLFEGQTDIVTLRDSSRWEYDPFEGKIVDGFMYG